MPQDIHSYMAQVDNRRCSFVSNIFLTPFHSTLINQGCIEHKLENPRTLTYTCCTQISFASYYHPSFVAELGFQIFSCVSLCALILCSFEWQDSWPTGCFPHRGWGARTKDNEDEHLMRMCSVLRAKRRTGGPKLCQHQSTK